MNRVLDLWAKLSTKPFGKTIFSKIVCWKAPYFGSIRPRFEELSPGFARVTMKNRHAVHNHIHTIHAIALCNLAELGAGTMMEASLSKNMRWLPKGMNVEYLKKAETDVEALCTTKDIVDGPARDVIVGVDIKDQHGSTVTHVDIKMWVSPKR
ncbi:MAG: hotdog fold domain-containing protein [Pseudomonadota bacterium]